MNACPSSGYALRDLPLPARLVISLFLISVGFGYVSALVQLHFQAAPAGKLMPGPEDAVATYFGTSGMSQLERLLETDVSKPFNGNGSMRAAFTLRSSGLPRAVKEKAREMNLNLKQGDQLKRAQQAIFSEREGERLALLDWIRHGADQKEYEDDSHPVPDALKNHPLTSKYLNAETKSVMIKSIVTDRCVRCHSENVGGPASNFPLESYERIREYCDVETVGGGMSLIKLAQTTHVHLLSFATLWGLTGFIFAFTTYPRWFRCLLGPFVLFAQLIDISCWWLGRGGGLYAKAIIFTGGAVGTGLFLQIVLSLFNLFGRKGKIVLIVLMIVTGSTGIVLKTKIIDPYLEKERTGAVSSERTGASSEE